MITADDWVNIIGDEIKYIQKSEQKIMSMIGSALIILAILTWFTLTNFIQNHDLDFLLILFIIQNFGFYFILLKRLINSTVYDSTIKRIEKKMPVGSNSVEFVNNKKGIFIIIVLLFLFILLLFCELLIFENIWYYFLTSSLIVFIIGIGLWILLLLSNLMDSTVGIYKKLRYDIISGEIKDDKVIRNKYLSINGKPPNIIVKNEKNKYDKF